MKVKFTFEIKISHKNSLALMGHHTCRSSHRMCSVKKDNLKCFQKQPFAGVLSKQYSENLQQIYRRTLMPKCYFNKVAKQHGLASVLLLHDKEEFRMLLWMNTETYEVSKFVLISRCAIMSGRGGGLSGTKLVEKSSP